MASEMKMLGDADMRALAALWRELADAPAAECNAALRHCMERLSSLIGACNVIWSGTARLETPATDDPLSGWRIRDAGHLHAQGYRLALMREFIAATGSGVADPYVGAIASRAGRTRSLLRRELMDDRAWNSYGIVQEALADERIGERLQGAHALAADRESHFALERCIGERHFSEYERDLLHFFLLGSRTFQRELLLSRGLLESSSPFSPRERDVAKLLLTDAGEKEIARLLGIGHRTVHQHAHSIYAKLGVCGRLGLMALWLRKRGKGG